MAYPKRKIPAAINRLAEQRYSPAPAVGLPSSEEDAGFYDGSMAPGPISKQPVDVGPEKSTFLKRMLTSFVEDGYLVPEQDPYTNNVSYRPTGQGVVDALIGMGAGEVLSAGFKGATSLAKSLRGFSPVGGRGFNPVTARSLGEAAKDVTKATFRPSISPYRTETLYEKGAEEQAKGAAASNITRLVQEMNLTPEQLRSIKHPIGQAANIDVELGDVITKKQRLLAARKRVNEEKRRKIAAQQQSGRTWEDPNAPPGTGAVDWKAPLAKDISTIEQSPWGPTLSADIQLQSVDAATILKLYKQDVGSMNRRGYTVDQYLQDEAKHAYGSPQKVVGAITRIASKATDAMHPMSTWDILDEVDLLNVYFSGMEIRGDIFDPTHKYYNRSMASNQSWNAHQRGPGVVLVDPAKGGGIKRYPPVSLRTVDALRDKVDRINSWAQNLIELMPASVKKKRLDYEALLRELREPPKKMPPVRYTGKTQFDKENEFQKALEEHMKKHAGRRDFVIKKLHKALEETGMDKAEVESKIASVIPLHGAGRVYHGTAATFIGKPNRAPKETGLVSYSYNPAESWAYTSGGRAGSAAPPYELTNIRVGEANVRPNKVWDFRKPEHLDDVRAAIESIMHGRASLDVGPGEIMKASPAAPDSEVPDMIVNAIKARLGDKLDKRWSRPKYFGPLIKPSRLTDKRWSILQSAAIDDIMEDIAQGYFRPIELLGRHLKHWHGYDAFLTREVPVKNPHLYGERYRSKLNSRNFNIQVFPVKAKAKGWGEDVMELVREDVKGKPSITQKTTIPERQYRGLGHLAEEKPIVTGWESKLSEPVQKEVREVRRIFDELGDGPAFSFAKRKGVSGTELDPKGTSRQHSYLLKTKRGFVRFIEQRRRIKMKAERYRSTQIPGYTPHPSNLGMQMHDHTDWVEALLEFQELSYDPKTLRRTRRPTGKGPVSWTPSWQKAEKNIENMLSSGETHFPIMREGEGVGEALETMGAEWVQSQMNEEIREKILPELISRINQVEPHLKAGSVTQRGAEGGLSGLYEVLESHNPAYREARRSGFYPDQSPRGYSRLVHTGPSKTPLTRTGRDEPTRYTRGANVHLMPHSPYVPEHVKTTAAHGLEEEYRRLLKSQVYRSGQPSPHAWAAKERTSFDLVRYVETTAAHISTHGIAPTAYSTRERRLRRAFDKDQVARISEFVNENIKATFATTNTAERNRLHTELHDFMFEMMHGARTLRGEMRHLRKLVAKELPGVSRKRVSPEYVLNNSSLFSDETVGTAKNLMRQMTEGWGRRPAQSVKFKYEGAPMTTPGENVAHEAAWLRRWERMLKEDPGD